MSLFATLWHQTIVQKQKDRIPKYVLDWLPHWSVTNLFSKTSLFKRKLPFGNCRPWALSIRTWCQIFFLLIIRLNLFIILCYCPASAASFTFLSTDSFLQEKRYRPEDNTARSPINIMCCPQKTGCRENSSLSTSFCVLLYVVWTQSRKTSRKVFQEGTSRPSAAATGAFALLLTIYASFLQSRETTSPLTWPAGTVMLSQSSFYLSSQEIYRKYSVI